MIEFFDSLKDLVPFSKQDLQTPATEEKIFGFRDLDDGWAYGNGTKFTDQVIEDSISVHNLITNYGFLETNAFPGESGEILITIYEGRLYSEIFVYENKEYDFIIESDDEEILRKERIRSDILIEELKKFRTDLICNLSELSTLGISIRKNEDTKVQPSKIQATEAEFQLSIEAVSSKLQDVFVSISRNSTAKSPVIQLSSGSSLYRLCPSHA